MAGTACDWSMAPVPLPASTDTRPRVYIRPSGEAYVEFQTVDDAKAALGRNRQELGTRYVEVYQATRSEMMLTLSRCSHSVRANSVQHAAGQGKGKGGGYPPQQPYGGYQQGYGGQQGYQQYQQYQPQQQWGGQQQQ